MPARIFKYHTTEELVAGVKELGKILASPSGATTALRNSNTGFLRETGEKSIKELRNTYMAARWEIYLRGQGVDGEEADATCLDLESTNPLRERIMQVQTIH